MDKLIQPTSLTFARHGFNIWEQRILIRILEFFQPSYKSSLSSQKRGCIIMNLFGKDVISIILEVKRLLPEGSQNYSQVKKALKTLRERTIELKSIDKAGEYTAYTGFILYSKYYEKNKKVELHICKDLLPFYLNISGGYTVFIASIAFNLKSPYAIRLYQQISHWKNKTEYYTVYHSTLKKNFGLGNRYPESSQFKQSILLPTMYELEKKADVYFSIFDTIKEGRKVTGWVLKLHKRNAEEKEKPATLNTPEALKYFLRHRFLLEKHHLEIIEDILQTETIREEVAEKVRYLANYTHKNPPKNIQAYVVKALLQDFGTRALPAEAEEILSKEERSILQKAQR